MVRPEPVLGDEFGEKNLSRRAAQVRPAPTVLWSAGTGQGTEFVSVPPPLAAAERPRAGLLLTVGEKKPSFRRKSSGTASAIIPSFVAYVSESLDNSLWTLCYLTVLVGFSAYGIHRWLHHLPLSEEPPARARSPSRTSSGCRWSRCNCRSLTSATSPSACCARSTRWIIPREMLEVQVLDDSTDDTRELIAARGRRPARRRGWTSHYIHRTDRTGFKAGALENGMHQARGRVHFHPRRRLPAQAGHPAQDDPFLHRSAASA